MKGLLPLLLLSPAAAPVDRPRTYLVSIGKIELNAAESITAFSIQTWGIEFQAVCRIPLGWKIKAGSSATSNGELNGEGSQGATWFHRGDPPELRSLVLVKLFAPIQRTDLRSRDGSALIPTTFKGEVTIFTDDDKSVQRPITSRNITLIPASHCPAIPNP